MLASSSLELCKHKREKRETATKSVCGWCQKLQGFKAQGAKNPTPLHKAKLPTASERGNVQRQFGTPQQAWSVDAHVASRKHQSLHANQTVGAVECRGEILRKNFSVNSTCAGYPLPNSLAQRKPRNIKNKIPFIAQSKKTSVPAANLTLTSVEGGGCGSIMQRETNRTQSARGNARLVIHLSAYHHTRPFT